MRISKKSMRPDAGARRLQADQISELVVIDRDGAQPRLVYDTRELIEAPNWTPDGQWLVYNGDGRLFRISPDGGDGPHRINSTPVENLNNDHVIAPDGQSIFVSANDGHLYVLPIAGGEPARVSGDNERSGGLRHYLHGISPDGGSLAYVGLERGPEGHSTTWICTMPATGGASAFLTDGGCPVDGPEFSADGEWIYFNSEAAATQPGHAQIFRMRRDGSAVEQLTHDARVNWFPHPSPDGLLVAYLSYPKGTTGHPADREVILRVMDPEGKDGRDLDAFNGGQGTINVNSWSPDSRYLAYVRYPRYG
ncbi:WD40-like Beta Propeller Repeat [Mesorhizobium albiziae]|uniref:WD40-like Beta Propeller Repeat n=2 Tax=Neomesorhizobium albiziae TaxID=335020 RepID=A0A1I3Y2Z9_9HYPH|nr:WD40-like Beta Propeller Repeat [Mesorhizobium albiziae]